MLASPSNPQLKNLSALLKKKKERDEQRVFVTEGRKMFEEARDDEKIKVRQVLVSVDFYERLLTEGPGEAYFGGIPFETVKASLFNSISETVTPQGILAVVEKPDYSFESILETRPARLILLENLQDPGNLGTIVRTAEGAGMTGIVMSAGTVDIFNPKVIRSTMGSIFRMPFVTVDDMPQTVRELERLGICVLAACLDGAVSYRDVSFEGETAIMIGNEGNGLSQEAQQAAGKKIFIPMAGKVESLNASVAAAILMYAAACEN